MKNVTSILFFSMFATVSYSQNLVLNPSFEGVVSRDHLNMYYEICKDWFNPNNASTDYYSPYCHELNWGNGYCTPNTAYGYQHAQDGEAFIALDIYEQSDFTGKEYAQGFLSQPLVQGQTYYVSMYINLADESMYKICEIDHNYPELEEGTDPILLVKHHQDLLIWGCSEEPKVMTARSSVRFWI